MDKVVGGLRGTPPSGGEVERQLPSGGEGEERQEVERRRRGTPVGVTVSRALQPHLSTSQPPFFSHGLTFSLNLTTK